MADIIRLEENGVTQYLETHVNAIVGRDLLDAKYLFSGNAVFNESINLSDSTDGYRTLLLTFSFSGNRGTLAIGNGTSNVRWGGINLTNDTTSTWTGLSEIEVTRISDKQYKVTFAKIVKDFKEVLAGPAANEISLISIVGIR